MSYTVASIGFVTTKPERLMPKGALAPVTPKHTMKEGIIYDTKEYRHPYPRQRERQESPATLCNEPHPVKRTEK